MRLTAASVTPGVLRSARCTCAWQAAHVMPSTGSVIWTGEAPPPQSWRAYQQRYKLNEKAATDTARVQGPGQGCKGAR